VDLPLYLVTQAASGTMQRAIPPAARARVPARLRCRIRFPSVARTWPHPRAGARPRRARIPRMHPPFWFGSRKPSSPRALTDAGFCPDRCHGNGHPA